MKIELSEYNSEWTKSFEAEKILIKAGFPLEEILIEHIGSTSVPNLKAKPVIDLMIGVPILPIDIQPVVNYLKKMGYQYVEEYNLTIPERRFFIKDTDGKRTHHLHLVSFNSDFWERHLFFRNQLRNNLEIRQQYEKLKTELSKHEWDSTNDYAKAKNDFIKSIEKNK
ncbi:MAG TPA: GrpB family protein [Bacteroidia bacterium]|nr:GrpB family protein [Bacteroidia bacterium]